MKGSLPPNPAILIPCFNAGSRIAEVARSARTVLDNVLVVDDGSTDGGTDNLAEIAVNVLRFPENRGKGYALIEGFRAALGDPDVSCVVTLDADGQHDPREVPGLLKAFLEEDADLVIGARSFDRKQVPWASRIGNCLTRILTGMLFGVRLSDTQSGFRVHSRRLAEHIVQSVEGGRYETEMTIVLMAVRGGYRLVSHPIATIYEPGNRSSHFRKVRDSWRVWRALFLGLWR